MSLGVNSMGFGHGGFGASPCGHGPWVTFQETPSLDFGAELTYAVAAHRFEDQSVQRVLRSRERGQALTFTFPSPDSGTVARVTSWFMACHGPATRFIAQDPRTLTPQVVRFRDAELTSARRDGMVRELPPVVLEVSRAVPYSMQLRATEPDNWWRLGEATDATSIHDSGTGVFTVASLRPAVIQGCSFGAPGLLTDDRTTAMACTSAVLVHSGGFFLIADHAVTALVQPTWPPRTFRPQPIYSLQGSGGLILSVQINSFGYLQAVSSGGAVLATASVTTLLDNAPHLVGYAFFAGFGASALYIDSANVALALGAPVVGVEVLSGGIASNPRSGHYFDGVIGDVALYANEGIDLTTFAALRRVQEQR